MQLHQIENWALQIIDRVVNGQPIEDARVELKAAWIDPIKAARRIAGHVETSRRPFVVKNPKQDAILFEVPWREGTRVRSARREDLVRLLSPLQALPSFEVLSGKLQRREMQRDEFRWSLHLSLYVESSTQQPVIIPFHRCKLAIMLENGIELPFPSLSFSPPIKIANSVINSRFGRPDPEFENASRTIEGTQDEVILYGPGRLILKASDWFPSLEVKAESKAFLHASIYPTQAEHPIVLTVTLTPDEPEKENYYKWIA